MWGGCLLCPLYLLLCLLNIRTFIAYSSTQTFLKPSSRFTFSRACAGKKGCTEVSAFMDCYIICSLTSAYRQLYNTDNSVKRRLGSVPLVSVLKRFAYLPYHININRKSNRLFLRLRNIKTCSRPFVTLHDALRSFWNRSFYSCVLSALAFE